MRSWRLVLALAALVVAVASNGYAQESASGGANKPDSAPTAPAQKTRPASPAFGTAQEHYVRIGGSEFAPEGTSAAGWISNWNPPTTYSWRGYFISNVFQHVYAWVHAPGGSLLTYIELDFCNSDPTHDLIMNVYACDFSGSCGSTPITTLTGAAGAGCAAYYESGIGSVTVDNYLGEYLLDVVWPSGGPNNATIALAGAIVGWKYQVAPAPVTATFPDVPTSDPGFQYVEALVASGITAGCGGGNYCPDNPLTRRQMAVFLSKALGLFWGGY